MKKIPNHLSLHDPDIEKVIVSLFKNHPESMKTFNKDKRMLIPLQAAIQALIFEPRLQSKESLVDFIFDEVLSNKEACKEMSSNGERLLSKAGMLMHDWNELDRLIGSPVLPAKIHLEIINAAHEIDVEKLLDFIHQEIAIIFPASRPLHADNKTSCEISL